jgi:hypothetical protein
MGRTDTGMSISIYYRVAQGLIYFFNIFQYDGFESWIFESAVRGHTIWMHSIEERV